MRQDLTGWINMAFERFKSHDYNGLADEIAWIERNLPLSLALESHSLI